jgi:pimeloyl-ACP methyl ester carboxylesterase
MSEAVDCDYSIQGSGPALFLTHGIGAAKNAWRFLLPELSKYFTVVTYDLRGHGNSPVTNKNFTLDDLVLDLEKIREKTKIDKAHFAGHSLGGMIAPAYAIKFPNRVLSVGLLSTVAGRSDVDKKNVLKIISEMEKTGVEQTLQKLTNRWFTDEFHQRKSRFSQNEIKTSY